MSFRKLNFKGNHLRFNLKKFQMRCFSSQQRNLCFMCDNMRQLEQYTNSTITIYKLNIDAFLIVYYLIFQNVFCKFLPTMQLFYSLLHQYIYIYIYMSFLLSRQFKKVFYRHCGWFCQTLCRHQSPR